MGRTPGRGPLPPDLQAGRPDQSRQIIVLAAIAWTPGVSTRSAGFTRAAEGGRLFDQFGAGIGKSTASRDLRAVSEQRAAKPPLKKRKVRVLGLDGTLVKIRGQEHGIIIALDLGSGQLFLT